jgi:hypothetical protein
MDKLRGLEDLLPFLDYLTARQIPYFLGHHRDDTVMLTLTMSGVRIEIDIFHDHMEYSLFSGGQRPEHDQAMLFGLIDDFVREDEELRLQSDAKSRRAGMVLRGATDLLPFIEFLHETHVWFCVQHRPPSGLAVMITLLGERIDVEFLASSVSYRRFSGKEDVETDQKLLFRLIGQHAPDHRIG